MSDTLVISTALCCGYGNMSPVEAMKQIQNGIRDHAKYNAKIVDNDTIINEPNLDEQPDLYENKEFFD